MMANGIDTHKVTSMRAIITFNNGETVEADIITLPDKPIFVEKIERELMNDMNARLTNFKVVKVHLLRN